MRADLFVVAAIALLIALSPGPTVFAQSIGAESIASLNLSNFAVEGVTSIQSAPGRPNDLFVGILDGRILRVDLTSHAVSTYATMPDIDQTVASGFFGLHGFTFSPNFATNGQLFVHVADERDIAPDVHHRNYVRRFDIADPLSNSPDLGNRHHYLADRQAASRPQRRLPRFPTWRRQYALDRELVTAGTTIQIPIQFARVRILMICSARSYASIYLVMISRPIRPAITKSRPTIPLPTASAANPKSGATACAVRGVRASIAPTAILFLATSGKSRAKR